jgi:hypothetical protein
MTADTIRTSEALYAKSKPRERDELAAVAVRGARRDVQSSASGNAQRPVLVDRLMSESDELEGSTRAYTQLSATSRHYATQLLA